MEKSYEVGQCVFVKREHPERVRSGIITEMRDTKAVIQWDTLDHATAKLRSAVPWKNIRKTAPRRHRKEAN